MGATGDVPLGPHHCGPHDCRPYAVISRRYSVYSRDVVPYVVRQFNTLRDAVRFAVGHSKEVPVEIERWREGRPELELWQLAPEDHG